MMKHQIKPEATALQFNDCITRRDLKGLVELMTEDHVFIDRDNNHTYGKQECGEKTWRPFFKLFSGYRNIFETVLSKDSTVFLCGYSVCANEILNNVRCIWVAKIEKEKVKEWRIYPDTEENRRKLGI